jgi:uncharacterized membrane protein
METVFDVLHVVSGVFLVGPMAILPMVALRALRAREAGAVAASAKSVRIFTWLSLIVVVLGFGVLGMSDGKHHATFASTWNWLSLVAYVVAMLTNLLVVIPALKAAAAQTGAAQTPGDKPAGYSRVAAGSGVSAILLVLIVVLMVWKP